MNILVVEDNIIASRLLHGTLERMGHHVRTVGDGAEAWRFLQEHHVEIVISDWLMPEMDGLELCRRLRERQGQPYTYVILLTAKDLREDRLEGLRSGADDFLVKPLDPQELTARLEVAYRILAMQTQLADTIHFLKVAHQRFSELYMGLPIACITYDAEGRIQDWNRACELLFQLKSEQVLQKTFWETVYSREDELSIRAMIRSVFQGEKFENIEWVYRAPDSTRRDLLCNTFPMFGPDGAIIAAIGTYVDITNRKAYERKISEYSAELEAQKRQLQEMNTRLEDLATMDGLTGLKNHRAFQERLMIELQRASRCDTPLSIIMLDVDRFKLFNDTFGHPAGDVVLKRVANIMLMNVRATDFVARYGGEEFVVILPDTDLAVATTAAERLCQAIAHQPWEQREITVSVGVASLAHPLENASRLILEADKALYAAKAAGRARVVHYSCLKEA